MSEVRSNPKPHRIFLLTPFNETKPKDISFTHNPYIEAKKEICIQCLIVETSCLDSTHDVKKVIRF